VSPYRSSPLLSMAALTVEHLKVLMVEPPKGSLSVEPPKGSLSVEPMAALLVERATHPVGPLFWGRGCLFGEGPQKRVVPILTRQAHPWRRFQQASLRDWPFDRGGGFGILSNAPTQNQKVGQLKCIMTYIKNYQRPKALSATRDRISQSVITYIIATLSAKA